MIIYNTKFIDLNTNRYLDVLDATILADVPAIRGRDLSIAGMYIHSRQHQREIYQSPACIYTADSMCIHSRQRGLSIAGMYIHSRQHQREIYQSPACIYTADSMCIHSRQRGLSIAGMYIHSRQHLTRTRGASPPHRARSQDFLAMCRLPPSSYQPPRVPIHFNNHNVLSKNPSFSV